MELSIILPCYNEERAIAPVLDQLLLTEIRIAKEASIHAVEIIVVDDGSNDSSRKILNTYKDQIQVISHKKNFGYGAALKTGFTAAQGNFIAILDMDNTYDPNEFLSLLNTIKNSNLGMVCGNRLHDLRNMPLTRRLGNFFFRQTIRLIFSKEVEDSCSGQRIFQRKYAAILQEFASNQLDFSLAATLLFLSFQWPFTEIPIRYQRRIGRSKLKIVKDGSRFFLRIIQFWLGYRLKFFKKDIRKIHDFHHYSYPRT